MYWEKRKDRAGKPYYSFIQWDPAKRRNVRLKRADIPANITDDNKASEFCKIHEANAFGTKFRIEQKLKWQNTFYNFNELLSIFEIEARKRAPNSYETSLYYLRQYAFDFYLNHKKSNNLNTWSVYYDDFRDWLLTTKPSKYSKSAQLAYGSRNNIIGALNLFMEVMHKKGKCDSFPKCQKFSKSLLNTRDASHVIDSSEAQIIYTKLCEIDPTHLSADFFVILLNTGLRLSEGLSLSLNDFYPGTPDNQILKGALNRHSLVPFGYISLESQLKKPTKPRNTDNTVERKPLKGRKRVDAKSSRIIPIIDKQAFNTLAKRYNYQSDLYEQHRYGRNRSDYLLFNGLDKNRFTRILREAYQSTQFKHKSPHCCRHTFATNFAGMANGDTGLCRLVLGHRDEDTTLGYVHLFEQINRQSRAKILVKNKIEYIL